MSLVYFCHPSLQPIQINCFRPTQMKISNVEYQQDRTFIILTLAEILARVKSGFSGLLNECIYGNEIASATLTLASWCGYKALFQSNLSLTLPEQVVWEAPVICVFIKRYDAKSQMLMMKYLTTGCKISASLLLLFYAV